MQSRKASWEVRHHNTHPEPQHWEAEVRRSPVQWQPGLPKMILSWKTKQTDGQTDGRNKGRKEERKEKRKDRRKEEKGKEIEEEEKELSRRKTMGTKRKEESWRERIQGEYTSFVYVPFYKVCGSIYSLDKLDYVLGRTCLHTISETPLHLCACV